MALHPVVVEFDRGEPAKVVTLMGELATAVEDLPRYVKDGFSLLTPELTAKLDTWIKELEAQQISFKGWATPGATPTSKWCS